MKISDELQSLCYLVRKSCISVLHLLMFAINATNLLSKIKKTFEQYGTICKCKCSDQIESIRRCWPKKLKSANQMKIRGFCYFCIMYTICQGTIQLQNSWFLTVSITHSKSFVLFVHSCGLTLFVAGSWLGFNGHWSRLFCWVRFDLLHLLFMLEPEAQWHYSNLFLVLWYSFRTILPNTK